MPRKVQGAEAALALRETFRLIGLPELTVDEVVVPVAIVADVRQSELKGTGYVSAFLEAALAGESAVLRFLGAAGYNSLPRRVIVRPVGTAGEVRVIANTTAVSSVLTGSGLVEGLNRWHMARPGAPVRVEFGTNAAAVAGGIRERHNVPADVDTEIDLEGYRVALGQELNLQFSVVNVAVNWTFFWDAERVVG